MTKFNRKGFMLAEVVVVSAIISIVLVTLFTGLNRVVFTYNKRNKYYDIDTAYIANEINELIIEDGSVNTLIKNSSNGKLSSLISNVSQDSNNKVKEFETAALESFNTKVTSYFSLYDKNEVEKLKDSIASQINPNIKDNSTLNTTKEYMEYILNKLNYQEDYTYIIIVEYQKTSDINDCYYYTLKVR